MHDVTPASLRVADSMLGLFVRAGFTPGGAVLRYQQVVRFLLSLVMLETSGDTGAGASDLEERERVRRLTFETLPRPEIPHLVAAAPYLAAAPDPEHSFESGLELLIGGLEDVLSSQEGGSDPKV